MRYGVRKKTPVAMIINPVVSYGSGRLGVSPAQVKTRRALAHACTVPKPRGRSATIDMGLQKCEARILDPAFALMSNPIHLLSCAIWDSWLPRSWIYRTWSSAFAFPETGSWRAVVDPLTAAAMSCARLGWSSVKPGTLRSHDGQIVCLTELCPKTVQVLAKRAVQKRLLRDMVDGDASLAGFGPDKVPWLLPLQKLVRCKYEDEWDACDVGFLRAVVAGAMPSSQKLYEQGVINNHTCQICGTLHAGVSHRLYDCPKRETWRRQYGLPDIIWHTAAAEPSNPFWNRALMPDPTGDLSVP